MTWTSPRSTPRLCTSLPRPLHRASPTTDQPRRGSSRQVASCALRRRHHEVSDTFVPVAAARTTCPSCLPSATWKEPPGLGSGRPSIRVSSRPVRTSTSRTVCDSPRATTQAPSTSVAATASGPAARVHRSGPSDSPVTTSATDTASVPGCRDTTNNHGSSVSPHEDTASTSPSVGGESSVSPSPVSGSDRCIRPSSTVAMTCRPSHFTTLRSVTTVSESPSAR